MRERESKDLDKLWRVHVSSQAVTWSRARLNDPLKDSLPAFPCAPSSYNCLGLTTPMWLNLPLADSLAQSSLKCKFTPLHVRKLALHVALRTLQDLVFVKNDNFFIGQIMHV